MHIQIIHLVLAIFLAAFAFFLYFYKQKNTHWSSAWMFKFLSFGSLVALWAYFSPSIFRGYSALSLLNFFFIGIIYFALIITLFFKIIYSGKRKNK